MATWKEHENREGYDRNNPDDGSIYLVSECGQVRSHDSEDDTPLQTRVNSELSYKLMILNKLMKLLTEVAHIINSVKCFTSE
jgi:hypothetical protein